MYVKFIWRIAVHWPSYHLSNLTNKWKVKKKIFCLPSSSLSWLHAYLATTASFFPLKQMASFVDLELRLFADESLLQSWGFWETYSLWECCWLSCAINTFIWVSSACLKFIVACFLLLSPRSVSRNYLRRHIKCGSLQPPRWVTFKSKEMEEQHRWCNILFISKSRAGIFSSPFPATLSCSICPMC